MQTSGSAHPLRIWRVRHQMSSNEFARIVLCSRSAIAMLETGHAPVSKELAQRIEQATQGEVKAETLVSKKRIRVPLTDHPLDQWRYKNNINHRTLARWLMVAQSTLSNLLCGKFSPSERVINRVESLTRKEVTAEQLKAAVKPKKARVL